MDCKATALSILFTDDDEIASLNTDYRKKPKPTDVLSFPVIASRPARRNAPHLGDLVISLETAKRQAKEYGVTFREEVLRLVVHGVLHLLGYEHEKVSASEARKMRVKEEQLYSDCLESW